MTFDGERIALIHQFLERRGGSVDGINTISYVCVYEIL